MSVRRTLILASFACLAAATPAAAQSPGDFFAALFGGLVRPQPVPNIFSQPVPEAQAERPRAQVAYCVRLCDGRYFPLSGSGDPDAKCAAFCPKAETRVYRGSGAIDGAENNGRPYSALPTAFLYRTKLDAACTCTGNGPLGLAALPAEEDESLKSGDVVVTREGPRVFQAKGGTLPHPASAFVAPQEASRLSRDIRQRIEDLRLAEGAGLQAAGKTR